MTFMDRAVAGTIPEAEWKEGFKREIGVWSAAASADVQRQIARGVLLPRVDTELHDYLGVTEAEYDAWCSDTDLVFTFVAKRRAAQTPRPIQNAQEFDAALARIDELMDAVPGTPEGDELASLSNTAEEWDRVHHPVAPPTPEAAAAFRAEQEMAQPATPAPARERPLRIYLAMSWKHPRHAAYVAALRAEGHDVFDFKAPPGGKPLGTWKHLLTDPRNSTSAQQAKALRHADATTSLAEDYEALLWADVVLAVGPFGVSTGVELGWAVGAGKRTAWVLADGPAELMPALAERVCETFEDALSWLSDLDRARRPERSVLTTFGTGSKRVACILRPPPSQEPAASAPGVRGALEARIAAARQEVHRTGEADVAAVLADAPLPERLAAAGANIAAIKAYRDARSALREHDMRSNADVPTVVALRARAELAEARSAEWAHAAQRVLAWSYDAFDASTELRSRATLRAMLAGGAAEPRTYTDPLAYSLCGGAEVWWLPEGHEREYAAEVDGEVRGDVVNLRVTDSAYDGSDRVVINASIDRLRRRPR